MTFCCGLIPCARCRARYYADTEHAWEIFERGVKYKRKPSPEKQNTIVHDIVRTIEAA